MMKMDSTIILLLLFIKLGWEDELHDWHGVTHYEIIECRNQKIKRINPKSAVIEFKAFDRFYNVCLSDIPNFVNPEIYFKLGYSLEHLSGHICDDHEFRVNGFLDNNCFYGSIQSINFDMILELPKYLNKTSVRSVLAYTHEHLILPNVTDRIISPRKKFHVMGTRSDNTVNPEKKYCGIRFDMDPSFIQIHGNFQSAATSLIGAISHLNGAIQKSGFGADPPIIFFAQDIRMASDDLLKRVSGYKDSDQYLKEYNKWLKDNQVNTCISSFMIYFTFHSEVGIAYVGDEAGSAICSHFSGNVITKKHKLTLSSLYLHRTFSHEVGHQLGCQHDPKDSCSAVSVECPGGVNDNQCRGDISVGHFLMYPSSSEFGGSNSNKFSSCSVRSIQNIVNLPVRRTCLVDKAASQICGNGIVEGNEECDNGGISDNCCNANCRLKQNAECSDYNGPCCRNCKLLSNSITCEATSDCTTESKCDGKSPLCKRGDPINEGKLCNDKRATCVLGECRGSLCAYHKLTDCHASEKSLECITTCIMQDGKCDVKLVDSVPKKRIVESPCNKNNGICLEDGVCYSLRPDSEISSAFEYVLSGKAFDDLKKIIKVNSIVFGTCTAGFIIAMGILTYLFSSRKISTANKILITPL